ncbi:hypothetical protein [Acetobacter malorum]|uniref:hypothetical protein n=1 Tax=Acetobacter malorum TaxID=178901 RepID=UPI0039E8DDD7
MTQFLTVIPGPHQDGASIILRGRAADVSLNTVSVRAPDVFAETQHGCPLSAESGDLHIALPPHVAGRFEPGTAYHLEIPELGISGDVDEWPSLAGIIPPPPPPQPPRPKVETKTETPVPPPVQPPAPARPAASSATQIVPKKPRPAWLPFAIASGIISLGVLAFLLFHFVLPHFGSGSGSVPVYPAMPHHAMDQDNSPQISTPPASGSGLSALSVPAVIQQAATPALIGAEGERRLSSGKPDEGLLLLEAAADRGDNAARLHLAHLYDPTKFDGTGPIPSPDMREAAKYYEAAQNAGAPEAAQDRANLHDWLLKQASNGDLNAQLALKDYWK